MTFLWSCGHVWSVVMSVTFCSRVIFTHFLLCLKSGELRKLLNSWQDKTFILLWGFFVFVKVVMIGILVRGRFDHTSKQTPFDQVKKMSRENSILFLCKHFIDVFIFIFIPKSFFQYRESVCMSLFFFPWVSGLVSRRMQTFESKTKSQVPQYLPSFLFLSMLDFAS